MYENEKDVHITYYWVFKKQAKEQHCSIEMECKPHSNFKFSNRNIFKCQKIEIDETNFSNILYFTQ